MAFFCTQTGARIVAPGVHQSVQPNGVPAHDGSDAAVAAEEAAVAALSGSRRHDLEAEPAPSAQEQARNAALKAFAARGDKPAANRDDPTKPDGAKADADAPTKGGRAPRAPDAKPDKP
jgi:hypothetical protein